MKINLPLIGQIKTGKDARTDVKEVIKEVEKKTKSVLGGFLDFGTSLSDETNVSSKVLKANVGWVYRNNDVIAKEVAMLEFELYKIKTLRDEVVYERIYNHPVLEALDKFNEFTTAYDGFYTTQSHRKLAGDSFWYIDRTGIKINNIFILPPDKVTINLGQAEGSQRIIQSYTYSDTVKGEKIEKVYQPEEVIHFKVPNPNNFYRGKGAVEAAADAIDTDTMAIEANKKLFQRGLIAELMLVTDKSLTPEQIKQLHSEFRNTYGGVNNAYKVPIFSGGIKPENVQMSNKDAQFLEQQEWLRDKICSIFGNPKSIITTDDVNRANADATILNWKRTTIISEMKGICDTLNEFLVPMFGDGLLLGFKNPVEEDKSQKIIDVTTLKEADIITLNEAREDLGLEPVKGGDEFNFERPVEQPLALRHIKTSRVLAPYLEKAQEYKRIKDEAKPIAKKILSAKNKEKRFSSDQAKNYYERQMKIVDMAEKVFADKVLSFINKIVDKALENVPNEVSDMQKKALFNEEELIVQAEIDLEPILMQVATQSGVEALNLVKSEHVYIPTNIKKQVSKRVKLFATSMVKTDKDKLIDIITEGVQGGSSIPQISQNIRDTFAEYSKSQADRVVRTEVLFTSNSAAIDAWDQSGEVVGKQWLISPDACPECEPYADEIVSLKGNFYSSSEFADGDPPLHPNCRCSILPILKGEMSNNSEVRVKQLEAKITELTKQVQEAEDAKQLAKELKTIKSQLTKEKIKSKKLEQEKSELEGFLDES